MAQHIVNLAKKVVVATTTYDVAVFHLLYITTRKVNLPFETNSSLQQVLFKNKDKTFVELKQIILGFYTQNSYKAEVVSQSDTTLEITLTLQGEDIRFLLNILNNELIQY